MIHLKHTSWGFEFLQYFKIFLYSMWMNNKKWQICIIHKLHIYNYWFISLLVWQNIYVKSGIVKCETISTKLSIICGSIDIKTTDWSVALFSTSIPFLHSGCQHNLVRLPMVSSDNTIPWVVIGWVCQWSANHKPALLTPIVRDGCRNSCLVNNDTASHGLSSSRVTMLREINSLAPGRCASYLIL